MSGTADSAAASRVPSGGPAGSSEGSASPPAVRSKSRAYRVGAVLLGVVVIVAIFVGVIPQFASYHDAWVALVKMSPAWAVAITAAAAINLIVVVWPFQAVLPQLRFRHGFIETQTSTAVATTVPAGGALALGLAYRMFGSFGFSAVAVSTALVTTGVWNLGFKLGLPVVAVVLLAVTGHSTGHAVGAALIGVALIAVSGTVLWLVFRDEASARRVGRLGDRILNWVLHFARKPESHRVEHAALHFRNQTTDIVHERGWLLTAAVAASQFAVFVLVVFCVRAVGIPADTVSFLAVLLSFAIARLAGALPITPGGLGSVDAAFTGMLIAFGATSSGALAADLVWRATTYFPPIVIGIVTYLLWKRRLVKGTYEKDPDVRPSSVPADG
ncbi:MAG TPA: lysylphosphatidylglycerol synthase transmembrane domain-containing protein [Streptosporangiaceae bacterium]|nr:lysylphosphatidylglycerol synthase transmembrane domain-containing protein [Streptosporangiaceae bacterium]